jgi:hypothetical protein
LRYGDSQEFAWLNYIATSCHKIVAVKNPLVGSGFAKTLLVKIKNFLPNLPLHTEQQQKIYGKIKFQVSKQFSSIKIAGEIVKIICIGSRLGSHGDRRSVQLQ